MTKVRNGSKEDPHHHRKSERIVMYSTI